MCYTYGRLLSRTGSSQVIFSFGAIVMGDERVQKYSFEQTLEHEYGHVLQLLEYGLYGYVKFVAIPSLTGYVVDQILTDKFGYKDYPYYSQPWEYEADMKVKLSRQTFFSDGTSKPEPYEPWVTTVYNLYEKKTDEYVKQRNGILQILRKAMIAPKAILPMFTY